MKVKIHNLSMAILLSVVSTSHILAIKLNAVYAITTATGIFTGIGSYYLGKSAGVPYAPAVGLLTGGGVAGLTCLILYSFTPEGRLNNATKKIERLCKNPIAMQSFSNEKSFFDALQELYVADDLWLIGAYNELISLLDDARDALELLDKVRSEASDNYNLIQQCNILSPRARTALINITEAVKLIRNNKEYIAQLKLYKEMIAAEKQLQLQREIAAAEKQKARAQMSMAKAQQDMADIKGIKTMVEIERDNRGN